MGRLGYKTLRERVVDEIRMKIVHQELTPGRRIIETNIAEELGVSRGPVREALRQLEQEGLVEYVRNAGCSVQQIDLKDIYEIYLLRSSYEILAVKTFQGQFEKCELEKLEQILLQMKTLKVGELLELLKWDNEFHRLAMEKAKLPRLLKCWEDLSYGGYMASIRGNSNGADLFARQYQIHKVLFDAFVTKDEKTIAEAIEQHYMAPLRLLMELVD